MGLRRDEDDEEKEEEEVNREVKPSGSQRLELCSPLSKPRIRSVCVCVHVCVCVCV